MPVTINGTVLKFIMFVGALHIMAMFFKVTRQSAFKEWPFPNCTKTLIPQIILPQIPCLLQFSMPTTSFIFIGWNSLGEKIEAIRRMLSLLPPPMNAPSSVWRWATLLLTRTVPSIKTCHCVT